jgi:L-threonylcarbamoyladenylate synthase
LINEFMLQCTPIPPTKSAITKAVAALARGELVILPTDTVYGIAATADDAAAIERVFVAKRRPADQPLQLLCADERHLAPFAALTSAARTFVDSVGPGAWTLIVPRAEAWSSPALAGGNTVGVRIPNHAVARDVIRAHGSAVAATSANRHGRPSPTTCREAIEEVGDFCTVAIDAGPCAQGVDSTVIDCTTSPPRVLREGAIDRRTVARILGLANIEVVRSVRPDA